MAVRNQDLNFSYWLVSSRPVIRKVALVAFVAFDVALVVFAGSLWGSYALFAGEQDAIIADIGTNIIQYASVNERNQPPEITVERSAVLESSAGEYDFVAIIENPSPGWALLSATYAFSIDDEEVVAGTTSLLPSEQRFLVDFGNRLSRITPRATVSVEFTDLEWRRVQTADDVVQPQFRVSEPTYTILSSIPSDQLSQVTATLTNGAVVPFTNVEITALLFDGTAIVGAAQLRLDQVEALSERPIDLRFFRALNVTNVLIHTTVDPADYPPFS